MPKACWAPKGNVTTNLGVRMLLREVIRHWLAWSLLLCLRNPCSDFKLFYVMRLARFQQNVWATGKLKPSGAVVLNFDAPDTRNGRKERSRTSGVRKHDLRPLACAKILIPLLNLYSACKIEGRLFNIALLHIFFPTKSSSRVDVLRTRMVFYSGPLCAPACGWGCPQREHTLQLKSRSLGSWASEISLLLFHLL